MANRIRVVAAGAIGFALLVAGSHCVRRPPRRRRREQAVRLGARDRRVLEHAALTARDEDRREDPREAGQEEEASLAAERGEPAGQLAQSELAGPRGRLRPRGCLLREGR